MQKQILFILFLIITSRVIYSQNISSISADATANLIYPISLQAGAGDLDFGEIILTGLPIVESIKPKVGKEFIIQGQKGRSITIYYKKVPLDNYEWALKFNGKFGRLVFYPEVVLYNNRKLNSGDNIFLKTTGAIGEARIYVGGKIKISATQPIGNYRGLFIISVAY
jgi:hypothetical protein